MKNPTFWNSSSSRFSIPYGLSFTSKQKYIYLFTSCADNDNRPIKSSSTVNNNCFIIPKGYISYIKSVYALKPSFFRQRNWKVYFWSLLLALWRKYTPRAITNDPPNALFPFDTDPRILPIPTIKHIHPATLISTWFTKIHFFFEHRTAIMPTIRFINERPNAQPNPIFRVLPHFPTKRARVKEIIKKKSLSSI